MTKRVELLFEFESDICKKSPAAKQPKTNATIPADMVIVSIILALVCSLILIYQESIPGRSFNGKITPPAEIVQEGLISKVWLSSEDDRYYVNVIFSAGEQRHRKCTLSTVGLYVSSSAEAIIGRIPTNPREESWEYTAIDVGLEKADYWRLRQAGWPMFGQRSL